TPTRRKNGAALAGIFQNIIGSRDVEAWRTCFKSYGLAFAVLNRAVDLPDDEQVLVSGAIADTDNPEMPRTIASPFGLADVSIPPTRPGPELGEHSEDVLREAGVDDEVIARLKVDGAIL
ncbi:MAG: CoA transferase, partial [Pseudomonadota bacterium]